MRNTILRCLAMIMSATVVPMLIDDPKVEFVVVAAMWYAIGIWVGIDIQKLRDEND